MPEYAAVLLAGGRSSRMGRDKALLPHPRSGLSLVAHQLATLRAAGASHVLLSVRPDQAYPLLPASLPRVHDSGHEGPLGALAATFSAFASGALPSSAQIPGRPPTHLLALAVDLPFISDEFLRRLLAACSAGIGQVPLHPTSDRLEPLCAVYPLTPPCRDAFHRSLTAARLSLQAVLRTGMTEGWMQPYPISSNDLPNFENWNIPGDLTRAH